MNKNTFRKIIDKEISCYKIDENDKYLAILDINPVKLGHTLVIPKKIYEDKIFNISEENFLSIMSFSRKIAIKIKKSLSCNRVGLFILGFEIPHIHIHLIPMNKEKDGNLFKKRIKLSNKKLDYILEKIRSS